MCACAHVPAARHFLGHTGGQLLAGGPAALTHRVLAVGSARDGTDVGDELRDFWHGEGGGLNADQNGEGEDIIEDEEAAVRAGEVHPAGAGGRVAENRDGGGGVVRDTTQQTSPTPIPRFRGLAKRYATMSFLLEQKPSVDTCAALTPPEDGQTRRLPNDAGPPPPHRRNSTKATERVRKQTSSPMTMYALKSANDEGRPAAPSQAQSLSKG